MSQDGAGAGQGAELGGFEEAFGGVAQGIEDRLDAIGAVFEAGVGLEGALAGVGIVMLGETTDGGAGRGEDDNKEVIDGGAVAG